MIFIDSMFMSGFGLQEILKDFLKYEDEKKYFDSIIDYDFSIFFDNLRDVNRYLNIFRFKKNALLNKVTQLSHIENHKFPI